MGKSEGRDGSVGKSEGMKGGKGESEEKSIDSLYHIERVNNQGIVGASLRKC